MSESNVSINVACPECGAALILSSTKVPGDNVIKLVSIEKQFNGKSYYLQYFKCPHCGAWTFVQVDDDLSKKVLTRNIDALLSIRAGNRYQQTRSLYERTKSDLTIMRKKLEKKLGGKSVYDPWDGSEHVIKFTHL